MDDEQTAIRMVLILRRHKLARVYADKVLSGFIAEA